MLLMLIFLFLCVSVSRENFMTKFLLGVVKIVLGQVGCQKSLQKYQKDYLRSFVISLQISSLVLRSDDGY